MNYGLDSGKVQIRLTTKQSQYALPDVPYTVEIQLKPADLNELVNTLLGKESKKTAEFDFLVENQYLLGSIVEHWNTNSISFENVTEIVYVERYPAPEPQDCLLHDDWVSAVKVQGNWILTGCYDNTINLWTTKGTHVLTIPGHTMPVKAVTWVSLDDKEGRFISVSQDQTAIYWVWNILENSVRSVCTYKGHQRGIDCIDISPDARRIVTGSWDTVLKLWSTEDHSENDNAMKGDFNESSTRTPIMTLQGHKECISAVHWMDSDTLLSGSWDQTLKIWNVTLEGIQGEITANKSIFDVDYSKLNKLIITASADKNLRLYDSRTNQGSVVRNTYLGHTQWIQAVTWSKTEEHLFFSGAYDNMNKLWDVRSPKAPLYDLIGHNDKVLDVDWSNPKFLVSGGADNTVRVFKSRKVSP